MDVIALEQAMNAWLQPERFNDYCPNGLQVQGSRDIKHVVTGVTACQALIDQAIELNADAVLVHHGYFWRGENPIITGMKQQRLKSLLENGMHLLAYHLPLDAHPEMGNNAQLAQRLDINVTGQFASQAADIYLGLSGEFTNALSCDALSLAVEKALARKPLLIKGGERDVKTIAWCTGAAQDYIDAAADLGVDAFLTGEVSERTVHVARERGIHFIAAGHHATERYGVQALGEKLAEEFGIQHTFVDVDNPV